jgi:hypothetical protein
LAYGLQTLRIRHEDMTFDDLIEKNEEYIIDPYETWDDSNRGATWVEDYPLDVLQWYLALILRSV